MVSIVELFRLLVGELTQVNHDHPSLSSVRDSRIQVLEENLLVRVWEHRPTITINKASE